MRIGSIVQIAALTVAIVMPAAAHHSYAGTYALDQTTTISGTIVQLDLRNPHSFIILDIKDSNGKLARWGVEWGGATQLTQTGVDKETLKAGDMLSVTGRPTLDPTERKVLTILITRPVDGWSWGKRSQEVLVGSGGYDPAQPAR